MLFFKKDMSLVQYSSSLQSSERLLQLRGGFLLKKTDKIAPHVSFYIDDLHLLLVYSLRNNPYILDLLRFYDLNILVSIGKKMSH